MAEQENSNHPHPLDVDDGDLDTILLKRELDFTDYDWLLGEFMAGATPRPHLVTHEWLNTWQKRQKVKERLISWLGVSPKSR